MKVLVIGTGAIGGFYGAALARGGADVSVVARSDYDVVCTQGVEVNSHNLGTFTFKPHAVYRDAVEMVEKPDYVLLCTKILPDIDQPSLIKKALGPQTAIVLIANGVEIEDGLAKAFPTHELISGLAFICVTRTAPGKIWHQDYGQLVLGNYPKGVTAKTRALCEAFVHGGTKAVTHEDVVIARWEKCLWNAAFNPLSVLSGGLTVDKIISTQEPLVCAVMEEVYDIATKLGHKLAPDAIDTRIVNTRKMAPYKTSMLVDSEAGRAMEIDAILGATVRAGKRAGVATPHLDSLYALMQLHELSLQQGKNRP